MILKFTTSMLLLCTLTTMSYAESSFNVADGVFSWLGSGHDTLKQKTSATCITFNDGDVEYIGADGKINLELSVDSNKVDDFLGIGASGRARAGAITYSAKAEYSRDSKANDFSISYNYIAEFNDKKAVKSASIHPNFIHLLDDGRDQISWKESCGNEFVFAAERGARIFLNFKIIFSSKAEKERIAAEIGVKGPAFEAEGKFEKISEKMGANTKMTVSAYQIGGEPGQLGSIFCRDSNEQDCKNESIRVADCSMGELKKCLSMVSSFMAYANSDFKKQISDTQKYSVLKVHTRPYHMLGGKFPRVNDQISAVFEKEVGDLIEVFNEQLGSWIFASDMYKNNIPRKTVVQKNNLELLKAKLGNNTHLLADAINGCYDYGLKYCQDKKSIVLEKIGFNPDGTKNSNYISNETINVELQPVMLSQFCDARESSTKFATTIDFLVKTAIRELNGKDLDKATLGLLEEKYKNNKIDWCNKLQEDLKNIEELEVKNVENVSLEIISTLNTLTKLTVKDSSIDTADYLLKLDNLEEITFENTNLLDIKFINKMSAMSKATFVNNKKLKKLATLKDLTNLESLIVYGNGASFECEIDSGVKCINQDYTTLVKVYENQKSNDCFYGYDLSIDILNTNSSAVLVSTDSRGITMQTNLATSNCQRVGAGSEQYPSGYYFEYGLRGFSVPGMEPVSEDVTVNSRVFILQSNPVETTLLKFFKNEIVLTTVSAVTNNETSGQLLSLGFTGINVTQIDDRNYLLTGGFNKGSPVSAALVLNVDLENKKLELVKAGLLKIPRFKHQVYKIESNKYLVVGGTSGFNAVTQNELLDLDYFATTGERNINPLSSKVVSNLKYGRHSFSMELNNKNELLVMGGFSTFQESSAALAKVEAISLDTFKVRQLKESLKVPRGEAQSLTMNDGKVLIIGGSSAFRKNIFNEAKPNSHILKLKPNTFALNSIEVFDPINESFFHVGQLGKARSRFGIFKVQDNQYLVAGGIGAEDSLNTLSTAELITIIEE
ncbi:MAG: hypothetical protein L6Q33_05815 [Bacteriovoracaceae bacterium]|nr:hypothetical protein [Bacteriovoracaceae bacterium]